MQYRPAVPKVLKAPLGGSERREHGGQMQYRPAVPKVLTALLGGSERSGRGGNLISASRGVRFVGSFALRVSARLATWPGNFTIH